MSYSCSTVPNLTTFNWQHLFTDCCLSVWWTDKRKPAKSDSVAIPQQTRWPHFHAFEHFTLFFLLVAVHTLGYSSTAHSWHIHHNNNIILTDSTASFAGEVHPSPCSGTADCAPPQTGNNHNTANTETWRLWLYSIHRGTKTLTQRRDEGGQKTQILRSWDNSNIQAWTETKKKQCQENLKTFHFAKSLLFISVSTFLNTFVSGSGGATQW